ncbi:MAG: imidazole glycerol phosphate synthase subunit HisH [Prevotella sp.]|nr:imidazole glycerol phosphate synthase subunit HisH [Prevotella sp.]
MKVSIVKYNAGNIFSVINAVKRLGIEPLLTDDREELMSSDKVIFPGQGEASNAMAYLKERNLDQVIRDLRQPVLGICIGQQLLCSHSEEGDTECIGVFPMEVKRFVPVNHEDKIPQMGWNQLLHLTKEGRPVSPLLQGLNEGDFVYFVHSYYVPLHEEYTIATTNFTLDYSAAIQKDNFFATQFHPEKSGRVGERILRNFLDIEAPSLP